jgi:uncharacterized protein (TIGR02996 family)
MSSSRVLDPLLERVHRQPDDDAARLVYADALLERGDPLGVFISHHLGGRRFEAEVCQLLEEHQQAWLGPLWGLAMHPGFGRGFLESCTLGAVPREHWAHPQWATVRQVTLERGADIQLLLAGAFRGLHVVQGSEVALGALLAQDRPLPFSCFVTAEPPSAQTLELLQGAPLKGLRRVSMPFLGPATRLARLCRDLGRRLDELTWRWDRERVEVRLTAGPLGPLSSLHMNAHRALRQPIKPLSTLIRALPPGLAEVRVQLRSDDSPLVGPLSEAMSSRADLRARASGAVLTEVEDHIEVSWGY